MNTDLFIKLFEKGHQLRQLIAYLRQSAPGAAGLSGLAGSADAVIAAASIKAVKKPFVFVLSDRETAAYFFNDLEYLLNEKNQDYENRNSFFFPSSYRKKAQSLQEDNANILLRSEVVNRLAAESGRTIIVTYPEAFSEKVLSRNILKKNILSVEQGEQLSVDFLLELLLEYDFERVDFVVEPGQFSLRGGIIDVFSFSNDQPFRIEIMGDEVESLRTFNPETQLSVEHQARVNILPDIHEISKTSKASEFLLASMPTNTLVWMQDTSLCLDLIRQAFEEQRFHEESYTTHREIHEVLLKKRVVEFQRTMIADKKDSFFFNVEPQPNFNKNFNLLVQTLKKNTQESYRTILLFDNPKQVKRIQSIFESILESEGGQPEDVQHEELLLSLHEGFIDHDNQVACYTDHQIFDRFHRYQLRDKFPGKQAMTLQSLHNLKPGDYVTHIDHGIGIFSGLEKIDVNGRLQEAIRLIYKNNDILYVSIHNLHRISKYSGKEGTEPALHRLGGSAWNRLKSRTKKKVKDIAHDLIRLYATRKAQDGHAFSPDTYLQHELEASFIFEDTPDQEKATLDVKKDMESSHPMDRLICGDVGFGKTEVAIRAAFKAVSDSKQVAVLVPTTILALQHYYTFSERLNDFPCNVDYVSRFRSVAERKKVLEKARDGEVDILIGTHRLLSKDIVFKDLGLLVIDEEQKFGVASKEKLKKLRTNVDTLTMTATPIPRTLQFSLMGARDLSYINTPPPNRYPIITEVHVFNKDLLRETIMYEVSRGGQVFFVHNRVQNITEVATIIQDACPEVKIAVGHGQLEGSRLEQIMVDFIHGEYDVLVSTTIIESGLDIPNANTIIINNAHHFGLSDLHQMRGRVGRSNKKAFCYLLSPPMSTLTEEARKRLKAIEEFSALGSGFNIAMRDLDIRGAGNLLGAEQSGFIAEVGFETYHKILDEAINELREEEYKDLFSDAGSQQDERDFVTDCQIETDLELMIPSYYVTNVEERLELYKQLDNIKDEAELQAFAGKMSDRFGPLPDSVKGLLQAIRLRRKAQKAGFEKIILKANKMIGHLPDQEKTDYYQSEQFGRILEFAQNNPYRCQIREVESHLAITIEQVSHIDEALEILTEIAAAP
ncbi:MAG: transcription-repair coupling factor [Bacteroidales bacterium]